MSHVVYHIYTLSASLFLFLRKWLSTAKVVLSDCFSNNKIIGHKCSLCWHKCFTDVIYSETSNNPTIIHFCRVLFALLLILRHCFMFTILCILPLLHKIVFTIKITFLSHLLGKIANPGEGLLSHWLLTQMWLRLLKLTLLVVGVKRIYLFYSTMLC